MQVAILNGITMGGGAGVSIPGTFRVVTDKTVNPLLYEVYNLGHFGSWPAFSLFFSFDNLK